MSHAHTIALGTVVLLSLLAAPAASGAQEPAIDTIHAGGDGIDGRRIPEYTHAWRSYRVEESGERQPLAVWYDTTAVVERGGERLLRRVQWIVPDEGDATVLLNEADRRSLLPRRSRAGPPDGEPFIDLRFEDTRVIGTRPLLPLNGSPADVVSVDIELSLASPLYDWRWWGVLVAALPLEPDYAARFLAFATETNVGSPLIWITARVVGEEEAGGVPCWVVEVDAGAPWTLWISKDRALAPVRRIHIEQPNGSAVLWESMPAGGSMPGGG